MESAVRYDFSFPPKSSNSNLLQSAAGCHNMNPPMNQHHGNNNNMRNQHHGHNNNNQHGYNTGLLPKSASTSLLTCSAHSSNNINGSNTGKLNNNYCNNCNNCATNKDLLNNNSMLQNNLNMKQQGVVGGMSNKHHTVIKPSSLLLNQNQQMHHGAIVNSIGQTIANGPQTPKDSNCSFTFDDLKNTLAFMEDSPLIKQIDNTSHINTATTGNSNVQTQLMVNATNPGSDSTSAMSSSSSTSTASSSSCNSCCAPVGTYLPKSNSNPMLLTLVNQNSSSSLASSGSIAPSSPTSANMCVNSASTGNLNHQFQANSNVLDLFINKKSPPTDNNTGLDNYDSYNSSTNTSIVTVASNNASLLTGVSQHQQQTGAINSAVETAAKKYRCAAQISEATCCWKGKLPPKQYKTPIVYSTKVFVGGLPWDITEDDIVKEFGVFGPCRVEWTNKEKFNASQHNNVQVHSNGEYDNHGNHNNYNGNHNGGYNNHHNNGYRNNRHSMGGNMNQMNGSNVNINNQNGNGQNNNSDPLNNSKHRLSPGFAYVIYESEYSVRSLVGNCIEDYQNGRDRVEYYFKISTRRVRNKEVQIIPWILADNNFALCTPKELDPKKTVFVGNLHGTMTARDLAHIMNELFGCVVYAGIDIDKLKYPIGSGRVTFSHQQNFMRAVRAAFVDIQSSKFSKRIQIDPYLEDVQCCLCYGDKGIYFCRDFQCFNYYCGCCWEKQHSYNQLGNHKPLMRKREDKLIQ